MSGVLYVVATPIGNLEDITLRALNVLKTVDLIACEDTRHTRKLTAHFQIQKPLESYHEHNEASKSEQLVGRLQEGKSIALVTDAGTPTISDPGYRLVQRCVAEGIRIVPVPGPVAGIAALSASGLPTDAFLFLGFPPAKASGRRACLERIKSQPYTLLFYEAPQRAVAFLQEAAEILGDRAAVVARELTKVYETFYRGRLTSLADRLAQDEPLRGELTIIIAGADATATEAPADVPESIAEHLAQVMAQTGLPKNEAIKQVAKARGLARRAVYNALIQERASEKNR